MSNNIRDTLVLQWNIYQHNHTFGLTGESSRNTCIESQVSASKQMQEHEPFSVLSDLPKTQATTLMPPWNYQRNLVRTCASDKMTTIHSSKRIIFKFDTQNRFCLKTRDWALPGILKTINNATLIARIALSETKNQFETSTDKGHEINLKNVTQKINK